MLPHMGRCKNDGGVVVLFVLPSHRWWQILDSSAKGKQICILLDKLELAITMQYWHHSNISQDFAYLVAVICDGMLGHGLVIC